MSETGMNQLATESPTRKSGQSLTSQAYQQLRADILSGRIAPGKKLRIKELQDRFNASVSVVREALSRLSSEDLVYALDQRGFVASEMSLADLKDLMRTRRQIEGLAIRQAIELGSPQWEAEVTAAFARLALLETDNDEADTLSPGWIAAHEQFHEAVVAGCDSPLLIRLCQQFSERAQRYRYLSVSIAPNRNALTEHKAILQAIMARDAGRAAAELDKHFATTEEILINAWTCT